VTTLGRSLRDRLLPAALTATGVTFLAAGLLSYTGNAAAADPGASADPTAHVASADPGASLALPTFPPPGASPSLTALPTVAPNPKRVATRIVIQALGIDLPVIKPRGDENTYPLCNVAMYIQELHQPGSGKATYIYAHARDGMFGPIYERAIQKQSGGPKSMVGMLVQVYTNDNLLFEYEITEVRLHQLNLNAAVSASTEQLWLQTSEGPHGTPGKTQLVAEPLIVLPADHAAANPKPHPVVCG
jgi:sortase family protein